MESQSLKTIEDDSFFVVNEICVKKLGHIPILSVGCFLSFMSLTFDTSVG